MVESVGALAGGRCERPSAAPVALAMLFAALTGCVTPSLHPADAGDTCAVERAALRVSRDYYDQAVAKGEAVGGSIGGAVGGALGALAGWLTGTDQSERPTAIGTAAGAAVGGFAGYYLAKLETATDAAALGSEVLHDLLAENQEIDRATVSFARLRECRFTEARQIKTELAEGQIGRAEAAARLDVVAKHFAEDLAIAEEVGTKMSSRSGELQYASAELLKEQPTAQPPAEVPRPTASKRSRTAAVKPTTARSQRSAAGAVAEAAETNQLKQKAFADEVAGARCEAVTAFALEGAVSLHPEVVPKGPLQLLGRCPGEQPPQTI